MGGMAKQNKGIIDVPFVSYRFKFGGATIDPLSFEMTHENICKGGAKGKPHAHTINLAIEFTVKYEKSARDS